MLKKSDIIYGGSQEPYVPGESMFIDALVNDAREKLASDPDVQGHILECGCIHNPMLLLVDITTYCHEGHYVG